jgi:drug/metabolite transporter (DMT)-like permease
MFEITNLFSVQNLGHLIGVVGMACVVLAYFAIERGWLDNKDLKLYLINLVGATLLLISLLIHFNLGSFIIEIFWLAISISGILNHFKRRKTP